MEKSVAKGSYTLRVKIFGFVTVDIQKINRKDHFERHPKQNLSSRYQEML